MRYSSNFIELRSIWWLWIVLEWFWLKMRVLSARDFECGASKSQRWVDRCRSRWTGTIHSSAVHRGCLHGNANKYLRRRGKQQKKKQVCYFNQCFRGASVFVRWSERMAAVRSVTLTNCTLTFFCCFFFALGLGIFSHKPPNSPVRISFVMIGKRMLYVHPPL